jgi:hypothetical protein
MSAAPPNRRRNLAERSHHDGSRAAVKRASSARRHGVVNAAVRPILERYVERLRIEFLPGAAIPRLPDHERQWRHDLGPFVTRDAAKTVMSGPARVSSPLPIPAARLP